MSTVTIPSSASLAVVAFSAGLLVHWAISPAPPVSEADTQLYTCTMHPQVRLPDPDAKCPICSMALVPVEQAADAGLMQTSFSEAAKRLMDVETVTVERQPVTAQVRMVGKINYDETRISYITAWVGGRLDRLFVDYTGMPVRKGYHMVELYSPQLLTAQEAVIQTARTVANLDASASEFVRESAQLNADAAREKLRLLGLSADQIDEIVERGEAQDRVTIRSPVSGIVVERFATQGQYVETGSRVYAIADLSEVWVELDAYESDLLWLRYGQEVGFTTRAYDGEVFTGRVAFISPTLDERTRTVRVRVNAPNTEGRLMPGMFVQAEVTAQLDVGGRVMAADLADKWICPMHPSVVKDDPGDCDICGMALVESASLGYVLADQADTDQALVVPDSAVLYTGRGHAVVYVDVPDTDKPTFELRHVTLGPRVGSSYIVRKGLHAGERVVARGAFKIDSERQLRRQPSMIHPPEETTETASEVAAAFKHPLPEDFAKGYHGLLKAYLAFQTHLAADDYEKASQAARGLADAVQQVRADSLDEVRRRLWTNQAATLSDQLAPIAAAADVNDLRVAFKAVSEAMVVLAKHFGSLPSKTLSQVRCPMAFDNAGATWLQTDSDILNPYFGEVMLRCGEVVEEFGAAAATDSQHHHD